VATSQIIFTRRPQVSHLMGQAFKFTPPMLIGWMLPAVVLIGQLRVTSCGETAVFSAPQDQDTLLHHQLYGHLCHRDKYFRNFHLQRTHFPAMFISLLQGIS
jgi:hypothetical protein